MTKQRELILGILSQSDRHLTADEIFFLAKLKMPTIAMATVYNNLNSMNEAGLIHRLRIDGGADRFSAVAEPHDHLVCDECGRVTDIRLPKLKADLEKQLHAEIDSYDLVIHTLCPACRRKK